MKYKNINNSSYNFNIYLKKDFDVFDLKYSIDGKESTITLSNKGIYSIHLGQFSDFTIEENKNADYKLIERKRDFSKFFKKFKVSLEKSVPDSLIIRDKEYIFEDLKEFNGNNLYCSFNRLLKIVLKYIESKNESIKQDIEYALDFLMNNWYTGKSNYLDNWWFYEIGVPRCLNEILFLLSNELNKELIFKYLNIERFYLPFADTIFYRRNYPNIYRELATYANLAENIYICTLRAILQETTEELDILFDLINNTIKIVNSGDGFYPDGSFIQHENVPYNGSYGEVLLVTLSKLLHIYSLIGYDCDNYVKKIQDILFESYSPVLYNGRVLESVRGRAVSRMMKNSKYSFDTIMSSVIRLKRLFSTSKLKSFVKIEENRSYIKFSKSFNYMDRFIARNKEYLFSINLNSKYISNFENINGENLLGDYSSNYTYDLIFSNNKNTIFLNPLYINPFYRNGSTNSFLRETPNYLYTNKITAGVDLDNLVNTCWHQNTDVKGYFSKFILEDSLVAVGTNIESDEDYISTVYNFNEPYHKNDNEVNIGKTKILLNNEFILEEFNESRSPKDLNVNQDSTPVNYNINRIYIKNPKEYQYQIYPLYKVDDDYEFINLGTSHILKFKNYLFINSFDNKEVTYENLNFKGRFSAILKYQDNKYELKLSTGERKKLSIMFNIEGYKKFVNGYCIKRDIVTRDELIYKVEYKK